MALRFSRRSATIEVLGAHFRNDPVIKQAVDVPPFVQERHIEVMFDETWPWRQGPRFIDGTICLPVSQNVQVTLGQISLDYWQDPRKPARQGMTMAMRLLDLSVLSRMD
jgi:hypothetical protein